MFSSFLTLHKFSVLILWLIGPYICVPLKKQQAFIVSYESVCWLGQVVLPFQIVSAGAAVFWKLDGLVHLRGLTHISDAFVVSSGKLGSAAWFFGSMWHLQILPLSGILTVSKHPRRLTYLAGHQCWLSYQQKVELSCWSECLSFSPCSLDMWLGLPTAWKLCSKRKNSKSQGQNLRSLKTYLQKIHYCHILLIKIGHRDSPD